MNLIKREKKEKAERYMCNSKERTEEKEGASKDRVGRWEEKQRKNKKGDEAENSIKRENQRTHFIFDPISLSILIVLTVHHQTTGSAEL